MSVTLCLKKQKHLWLHDAKFFLYFEHLKFVFIEFAYVFQCFLKKIRILKGQLTITSKKEIHPKATFATLLQKLFWFFFHCMVLKYPGFHFAIHLSCYCLNVLPRHHGPYGPYLECFPWAIKDWPWSLSFPGIYHLLSYSYNLSVFFLIKILSYRYFI